MKTDITVTKENGEWEYPMYSALIIDAYIYKTGISCMDTKANEYDEVRLEDSPNKEMNEKFLKLVDSIEDNLQDSYLQEKYYNAFDNLFLDTLQRVLLNVTTKKFWNFL